MYEPESKWNRTPTQPENWKGTKEVGPGDVHNPNSSWRTGKSTVETVSPSYNKAEPRMHVHKSGTPTDLADLMKEFGV
jgi:hypothetical protein